jgi:transposase
LRIADQEDGFIPETPVAARPATGTDLEAENREQRGRAQQLEQKNEILRRATAYFAREVLPK